MALGHGYHLILCPRTAPPPQAQTVVFPWQGTPPACPPYGTLYIDRLCRTVPYGTLLLNLYSAVRYLTVTLYITVLSRTVPYGYLTYKSYSAVRYLTVTLYIDHTQPYGTLQVPYI